MLPVTKSIQFTCFAGLLLSPNYFLPLFILLFIHSFMYLFICIHHLHINTNLHQHHSPQQWLRLFSQGNIITECDCGWFSWTVCISALTRYSVFRSFCSTHIKVSLLFYSCRIHKWKWWLAQTHAHVPTSEVECEALAVAHELSGRCSYVVFFLKRATLNGLWKWDHGQGSFTRCSWRRLWFFFLSNTLVQ